MSLIRPMFVFAAVLALGLLVGCSSAGPSSSGKVGGSSSGSPSNGSSTGAPSDGSSKGAPSSSAVTIADCPAAVVAANMTNNQTQVKLADIPQLTKASIDLEPSCAFRTANDSGAAVLAYYVTKQTADVLAYYTAAYTAIGVSSQDAPPNGFWPVGSTAEVTRGVALTLGTADTDPVTYPLFTSPYLVMNIT